jgi:thymidylate synthase, flavin-dependent
VSDITLSSEIKVHAARCSMTDYDVMDAARVSTLGESTIHAATSTTQMRGLINFLMRDRHGTPFEHNSITFMVKAPIFVAREFMRHRAGWSYNEESGRYRQLKPEFYLPAEDRNLVQSGKPGAYHFELGTVEQRLATEHSLGVIYRAAYSHYQQLLDQGVAREVARMLLPVGLFTTFYATCNARSLMHFLSLRTIDERATVPTFPQREIELVADQMEELWAGHMPLTHEAFNAHGRVAP